MAYAASTWAGDSQGENEVLVMFGNGDGTFQTPAIKFLVGKAPYERLRTADLNEGGKPDLSTSNWQKPKALQAAAIIFYFAVRSSSSLLFDWAMRLRNRATSVLESKTGPIFHRRFLTAISIVAVRLLLNAAMRNPSLVT